MNPVKPHFKLIKIQKGIILTLLLFIVNSSFAQPFPYFEDFIKRRDFKELEADSVVKSASDFLLKSGIGTDKDNRMNASFFILKWMEWTPDYLFDMADLKKNVAEKPMAYTNTYWACIVKCTLSDNELHKDTKKLKLCSVKMLLTYCENPDNNLKFFSPELQKLFDADKKGELEKVL